jgi:hypothetical protein
MIPVTSPWRFRVHLALAIAVPLEVVDALMLRYVPRVGVPRDPNPWHLVGGDVAALIHAPWFFLSDFLCVRFCPPPKILWGVMIVGGYLDTVMLAFAAILFTRLYRYVVSSP